MKSHERSSASTPLLPAKRRESKRPNILFIIPLLSIAFFYFLLPLSSSDTITMGRYGKTINVRNYTVIQGVFKQSDPDFVDYGYDLLGDSFGLIDQEGDKWGKFERYV